MKNCEFTDKQGWNVCDYFAPDGSCAMVCLGFALCPTKGMEPMQGEA